MKVVNVNLLLQFDHFGDEGEVTEEMVESYVEMINVTLSSMHNDSQPQLFTKSISQIDVIELEEDED